MIDLSGIWTVTDATGAYSVSAQFPGDIHTALLDAGIIPDPFVGRNEIDVQWVGRRGWNASRTFIIPSDELDASNAAGRRSILEFDAVDTIAEVFVNSVLCGRSSNAFVPFRIDVGSLLVAGKNTIEVRFDSPEEAAAARAKRLPYAVPHQTYPLQSMHRNLVRKVQCHSSWDWGIALMVSGLYGDLRIRQVGTEALVTAYGVPRPSFPKRAGDRASTQRENVGDEEWDERLWRLPLHIEWDRDEAPVGSRELPAKVPNVPISVAIFDPDGSTVASHTIDLDENGVDGAVTVVQPGEILIDLQIEDPQLWWPAGYGPQPLYRVTVRFGEEERSFETAFRTVEVVNEGDEGGTSMYFRVNGVAIWAKGANWIPIDAFPSRITEERYRNLLFDAADVNMNMIRVWGGGQYESEPFYRICDELGILVWQDFMFSCSLYPSERWFLEEVRDEVRAQTKRLMTHPSIAIWCGNNENIGALGWFEESIANPGRYLIDFDRLNNGVIATEVAVIDDTRVFWPSSPAAGEGDFSDNWHDDSSGDMHYWSVWHEGKPFEAYYEVTPRFCSEFGFQSFPSLPTLRSFAKEDQLNPTSPEMEHHQRNPRGNTVILETMSRYFRVPFDFKHFVYLSQVQQAMAIETAVTFWRSQRPVSMGALYWQINDLWPVVSWSSIEYDGRWKLLHYAARRFFAPRRILVVVKDGVVSVTLANDPMGPIGGTVRIRGIAWDGIELMNERVTVTVSGGTTESVWSRRVSELAFVPEDGFIVAEFEAGAAGRVDAEGGAGAAGRVDAKVAAGTADPRSVQGGYALLTHYKAVPLAEPGIQLDRRGRRTVAMTATTAPAFWVTVTPDDARYQPDDNGFLLLKGETREIELRPIRGLAGDMIDKDDDATDIEVTVTTIRDTY